MSVTSRQHALQFGPQRIHTPQAQCGEGAFYTGVTRGKLLVVLVGQKKAVAIAVRNASGRRRWSKLAEWLRPCLPVSRRIGTG